MSIRNYDWLDWSDGWIEYLRSKSMLEADNGGHSVHSLHLKTDGSVHDTQRSDSGFSAAQSLRSEWRDFVSDLVQPQLACQSMRFITLTFRDIRGGPPTITHGRKEMEAFLGKLSPHTDSFVFVEERGKVNERLHYHGCIRINMFKHSVITISQLLHSWRVTNGFYKFEKPGQDIKAINYTAKYIVKGQYAGDAGFWAKRSTAETQILMELK